MAVEIRLRCRWCGRPDVAGCDCEASQEIAHLKQQRDEAVRCSEESAEIMRRARARLTRERDSLELELRATESVRVKDNEHLLARAEQAEEQLRLSNIDAAINEAEANDLRAERDRLREFIEELSKAALCDEAVPVLKAWASKARTLRGEEE